MIELFDDVEPGDLLRAIGPVFAIDSDYDPFDNGEWEGNVCVWPKGTIVLVIEKARMGQAEDAPVIRVLVKDRLVTMLLWKFEIIRKSVGVMGSEMVRNMLLLEFIRRWGTSPLPDDLF